MATTFAETAIKFVADTSALKPQLAGIEQQIGAAAGRMGAALKTGILAGTAAIAAAVTSLGVLLKTTADAGDEINKLSQRVAIGASTLSGYKLAAQLSDLTLQDFGANLQKLSRNMVEASRGTGEAQDAFKMLGISVTDNAGKLKTAEQVMLEVADKFARMEDGAQKTALAMDIFGKAGAAMIPFLNQGKDALEAQRKEAELFGATFNAFQAKTAEDFNDTLTRIGTAVKGFATQVGNLLLPLANEVLGALLAKLKELAESGQLRIWAVQTAEAIVRGFVWATQAVGELAKASMFVVDSFRTLMAAFHALRSGFDELLSSMLFGFQAIISMAADVAEPLGLAMAKPLRDAEAALASWAKSWQAASKRAADSAVGWWEAIGTSNAGAEAFAKRLDAMGKSVEDWAGRAMAASIKAAAGLGGAAEAAAGKWEILEFQVDGVTKQMRVFTQAVSRALPQAAATSLGTGPRGPEARAAPGAAAAEPASPFQAALRDLAASGRQDLLEGFMGQAAKGALLTPGAEQFRRELFPAMDTEAATVLGRTETLFDQTFTRLEQRAARGAETIAGSLTTNLAGTLARRLYDESTRGIAE